MHTYAVGTPSLRGATRFSEGVEYTYRRGAHELRMFFSRPSQRELAELQTAPMDVAVFVAGPVIFFLYTVGTTFA